MERVIILTNPLSRSGLNPYPATMLNFEQKLKYFIIMINQIKSEKVRGIINAIQEDCCSVGIADMIDAVVDAERDAEDRAKSSFKRLLRFNGGRLPETISGIEMAESLFDAMYNDKL